VRSRCFDLLSQPIAVIGTLTAAMTSPLGFQFIGNAWYPSGPAHSTLFSSRHTPTTNTAPVPSQHRTREYRVIHRNIKAQGTEPKGMSPTRTRADIVVVVPKHNAQRPNPALAKAIASVVQSERGKRTRLDLRAGHARRPRSEAYNSGGDGNGSGSGSSDALKAAIESASEWNSLLLTARAERGPQFDVPTQQYVSPT
jgi:hypothetical protein